MNRNYIILALIFIILAGGILILPERENYQQIPPEELMREIIAPTRYVTTDQVSDMIIQRDPTLMLVDVRNEYDYFEYSLPGALNIPLDSLMAEDYKGYLGVEDMNVVFFSNDDIMADQAWVLSKRMGYQNLYVMKGGLNYWIKTIIQPERPDETASEEEFERYNSRRGASMYFTGADMATPDQTDKKPVVVQRKKKSTVAEGGC
ncbi:MAG: rhodanese-like domain-containing protein [bacterium]